METTQLVEVKRLAATLQAGWVAHQGRRMLLALLEGLFYILALLLLFGDMLLIAMGHKLPIAVAREGPVKATTSVEDERVTTMLIIVYILLGLMAVGSFIIARLISRTRKRRAQVQALCAAVAHL